MQFLDKLFLTSTVLVLIFNLNYFQVEGVKVPQLCAKLFKDEYLQGAAENSEVFLLKDGTRVSNFEEEYITIDTVWNETRSFQIADGCVLSACNSSFFDGFCQHFNQSQGQLPQKFKNFFSASCTCKTDCKCSDIVMKEKNCARAYLKGGCNTCNPYYTDLKGDKPWYPEQFSRQIEAIKVREGCSLIVYKLEDYEGQPQHLNGTHEVWNKPIGSYECNCNSYTPQPKPPRPNDKYPVLIDIPESIDKVGILMQGDLEKHPGLVAARRSLKSGRSSKNAYILLLGTSGSGKSSTINLLFDNPNITKVGGKISTTKDIHEFRISVPVDELGINNSELRVIDTPGLADQTFQPESSFDKAYKPVSEVQVRVAAFFASSFHMQNVGRPGFEPQSLVYMLCQNLIRAEKFGLLCKEAGDTNGLEQDAKFLATLDDYLSTHEELKDRLPNVVLIFNKFDDNRFEGNAAAFVKMLRAIDSFREKITDEKYSNVVFVFSHFCSVLKELARKPNRKLQEFKSVIEEYSQFPKPVVLVVAENKGDGQDLLMVNGYHKLPNGEYYPKNLFDKIQVLTAGGDDPIGDAVIRTTFRDSDNFIVNASTYELSKSSNAKVEKYHDILIDTYFKTENTEISQLLATSYERMDPRLKLKFPVSLKYLERALNVRDIRTKENIPRTSLAILQLLSSLKKNEAIIFLLQNALLINPPVYEENVVTGYSYNVFLDLQLPKSPYQLGDLITSDIGYLLPSAMTCTVKNQKADVFTTTPDKAGYLKMLLENLAIEGSIPVKEFKGATKPGFNIENENFLPNSCHITAIRELRTFELNLNDDPKLTPEFISAVQALPSVDQSDPENLKMWRKFFNEYGTHVIRSVYGGGSITIDLKKDKACDDDILAALFKLIEFAEDLTLFNENSTRTLNHEGVRHSLKFKGGDSSFHTADLTKMSLGAASKLLRNWKNSLKLKPVILNTEMKLYPISSVAKKLGLNISSEIQLATSHLFNSTLNIVPRAVVVDSTDRQHTALAQNKVLMDLIKTMLADMKAASDRHEASMAKWNEDLRLAEERRFNATHEFKRWEVELRHNQTKENAEQRGRSEQRWIDMMNAQQKNRIDDEKRRQEKEEEKERATRLLNAYTTPKPIATTTPKTSCLEASTPILLADFTLKPVQELLIGDMLLDHQLKPTKVLGVSKEFLRGSTFYGFVKDSYFFTQSHLFIGPKLGVNQTTQIYVKDLPALLTQNPLMEYLDVKEMKQNFPLYGFNKENNSVVTRSVQVFENPSSYPEDTLVYFIQVDSPSGSYIANGYVCRHEIPPIEHWPNTMAVLFSVFSNPKLSQLQTIPYTLISVEKIEKVVLEVLSNMNKTIIPIFISHETNQQPKMQLDDVVVQEVLGNIYNGPSFSAFGVGIYGTVGKYMAELLDNPDKPVPDEYIGTLQQILCDELLKQIQISYDIYFSNN